MKVLVSIITGILFGLGLSVSQMIDPAKVVNFMDVAGNWDPSLAFVMIGGLIVNFVAVRWILKRPSPVFAEFFRVPAKTTLDMRLIFGAALFGIGWAIAGYCPGPAIASFSFVSIDLIYFFAAYVVATAVVKLVLKRIDHSGAQKEDEACTG